MRSDWRRVAGEPSEIQRKTYIWYFTDDKEVMTLDLDGLNTAIPSAVEVLKSRTNFDPDAFVEALKAIRFDRTLLKDGHTRVEGKSVQGFDVYGLMQDAIALPDAALDRMDFGEKYDDELGMLYSRELLQEVYTIRLLLQRLRNGQGRAVIEFTDSAYLETGRLCTCALSGAGDRNGMRHET